MALKPEDEHLSRLISRPGKIKPADLRQLLVGRLAPGWKAVLRRGLRQDLKRPSAFGLYCEHCAHWWNRREAELVVTCGRCGRRYEVEFVVYQEIKEE